MQPASAVDRILASGVFDVGWYGLQAGRTFADAAEAVSHYLDEGRSAGWSPHPLFLPARVDPRRWDQPGTDPLVAYLDGAHGTWAASTSPLFDPAGARDVRRPDRAPLVLWLRDGDPDAVLPAPDAGWLCDGVTLTDVREALRAQVADGAPEGGPVDETVPGLLSVVVTDCATTSDVLAVLGTLDPVARGADDRRAPSVELVLVRPEGPDQAAVGLALARLARWDVRVVPAAGSALTAVAEAVHRARGEHTLLMSARDRFTDGALADWCAALAESDAAAVHPLVLDARLLVHDAGVVYAPHGADPVRFLGGMHPDAVTWPGGPFRVPGAPVPLLARTGSVRGALDDGPPIGDLWGDVSLSQRLAAREDRPVVVVPGLVATRARGAVSFDDSPRAADDLLAFRRDWRPVPPGSTRLAETFGLAPVFVGVSALTAPDDRRSWTRALWLPAAGRAAADVVEAPPSLRWAIKIAAPPTDRARQWGDLHFATSLADALRDLGQRVVVDRRPNDARFTSYTDDVVLALRGLVPVTLPADVTRVAWVISHPDAVTGRELATYDLRYAASRAWAHDASTRWGLPVRPLLQCTDPNRFHIDDEPVPEVVGKAVFVGNSRGVVRPVVVHTAETGTPLVVYGDRWEEFVRPEVIAGTYVPNDVLRRYYRSADWALNDHWPDMRERGFVSNRVFDVLASGGRLLTDDVEGLDDVTRGVLPEGGLPRFRTSDELDALLAQGSGAWYDEASLRALSDHVRAEHSFGARARVLLEDVLTHRAASCD